mmetsp:Transcript_32755/g.86087  ORF Transcript_32755/g.86087 Transcript_32755/m.86087 type:complete len:217 (-) Transcript_32755:138-788(-)
MHERRRWRVGHDGLAGGSGGGGSVDVEEACAERRGRQPLRRVGRGVELRERLLSRPDGHLSEDSDVLEDDLAHALKRLREREAVQPAGLRRRVHEHREAYFERRRHQHVRSRRLVMSDAEHLLPPARVNIHSGAVRILVVQAQGIATHAEHARLQPLARFEFPLPAVQPRPHREHLCHQRVLRREHAFARGELALEEGAAAVVVGLEEHHLCLDEL